MSGTETDLLAVVAFMLWEGWLVQLSDAFTPCLVFTLSFVTVIRWLRPRILNVFPLRLETLLRFNLSRCLKVHEGALNNKCGFSKSNGLYFSHVKERIFPQRAEREYKVTFW